MGTGSFPGVNWPGRGFNHALPSSAVAKERVELYLYSPSGPSWPVLGRTSLSSVTYDAENRWRLFANAVNGWWLLTGILWLSRVCFLLSEDCTSCIELEVKELSVWTPQRRVG